MLDATGGVVHASGPRPTTRQLVHEVAEVAASLPLFALAPLLRRWHRHWGATPAEAAAILPGDELVPGCQFWCTRAISIAAPPPAVWPWLVQVGYGRAGFYSNDLLDNAAHPSAERIVVELQDVRVGDWVPMFTKVNDRTAFKVATLVPPKLLVWAKPDSTWAWRLEPENAGTRLVTRLRMLYHWSEPLGALASFALNELGDFAMMRRMLLGIKRRAETKLGSRAS
jgi:hypothetical protein